jgi:DNA-binding LacI/PurR family transcriptional regulator
MASDGYRAMKRALSLRPRIDAVFAANDPAAIGAMKAVWEAGLQVPDDIAIVGAGDVIHGELLKVPLTTVSWSRSELGREAAELLMNGAERNGSEPRRVIIPPHLVIRQSCGGA